MANYHNNNIPLQYTDITQISKNIHIRMGELFFIRDLNITQSINQNIYLSLS
jgi:hypothetical protein